MSLFSLPLVTLRLAWLLLQASGCGCDSPLPPAGQERKPQARVPAMSHVWRDTALAGPLGAEPRTHPTSHSDPATGHTAQPHGRATPEATRLRLSSCGLRGPGSLGEHSHGPPSLGCQSPVGEAPPPERSQGRAPPPPVELASQEGAPVVAPECRPHAQGPTCRRGHVPSAEPWSGLRTSKSALLK